MSDPVTNIEIEDVLSSIRRLVSDGDKGRMRDNTAPDEGVGADDAPIKAVAQSESSAASQTGAPRPDKLVLTPAYLVAAPGVEVDVEEGNRDTAQPDAANSAPRQGRYWTSEEPVPTHRSATEPQEEAPFDHIENEGDDAPFALTEMVWDSVAAQTTPELDADTAEASSEPAAAPDRSSLVATIAELEAAISTDINDYEPEGNEPMGETIAWPGAMSRRFIADEDAELSDDVVASAPPQVDAPDETLDDHMTSFRHATPSARPDQDQPAPESFTTKARDDVYEDDVYEDDDLDGLLEAGGVSLDEAALRALVSEVVREELSGPLGERITRNVRKLVRREVYRVLSSQEFD